MTRINLVKPRELTDQHLVAEYREIVMVPAALRRSLRNKYGFDTTLPTTYVLGTGHVRFFYDKGLYLFQRYQSLVKEMRFRGMNPDPTRRFPLHAFPSGYRNNYIPDDNALLLIRTRIMSRIAQKPYWYRYFGKTLIESTFYDNNRFYSRNNRAQSKGVRSRSGGAESRT